MRSETLQEYIIQACQGCAVDVRCGQLISVVDLEEIRNIFWNRDIQLVQLMER